jgi:Fe2+ or Zn2+ uptake regulation protein
MRKTPLLEAVKNIFESKEGPINVPDLQNFLKIHGFVPNKTSLYRMLDRLKTEGFIDDILLDTKTTYYERKTHHHHHFTCDSCRSIECITDPELESHIHLLAAKLEAKGLVIKEHHLSFAGNCLACA